MKLVTQEDRTGCAFAAVAMSGGTTYQKVKKAAAHYYGISVDDSRLWSETSHVRTLLKHYGITGTRKEVSFVSWEKLPALALLAVKWHRERTHCRWHWVVFWQSPFGPVVLDPNTSLQTNIRKDFGRLKPKWCIGIQ